MTISPYRNPIAVCCFVLVTIVTMTSTNAQSTIAPRPLDLTFGKSFWGTLLPSYSLSDGSGAGKAFNEDMDSLGALWEGKLTRRVLDTRTSFEARGFYGLSFANQSAQGDATIVNPLDGSSVALTGGQGHLSTDLNHYGFDLAIIDTWRTRFGGLSAGIAFSYMAFDQDFDARYANAGLFEQELNSDFLGGKGILGWEGHAGGLPTSLTAYFGYYDLEIDYAFDGRSLAGTDSSTLADHSGTVELRSTTWAQVGDYYTGFTLGAMHLSDFAKLRSVAGEGARVSTTDATTLLAMVEILY